MTRIGFNSCKALTTASMSNPLFASCGGTVAVGKYSNASVALLSIADVVLFDAAVEL